MKADKVQKVFENQPEFVPEKPEEVYLINKGFKYSYGNLKLDNKDSLLIYNLDSKKLTVIKDGGTIVLSTGGEKDKIERFYNKYFI